MESIEFADALSTEQQRAHAGYITHALCTGGTMHALFNGKQVVFTQGDCLIARKSESLEVYSQSEDFSVQVVYVSHPFIELATPMSNYGIRGCMLLFDNPVMHFSVEEQCACLRNFRFIRLRFDDTDNPFYRDALLNAVQNMILDFFRFHARKFEEIERTDAYSILIDKFLRMLDAGDFYKHRDVAYYANALCVTPKYLSEASKKISGFAAAHWITRYTALELSRMLRNRQLTLSDIAELFNFSSNSHLTRYVQINLGISPQELRG